MGLLKNVRRWLGHALLKGIGERIFSKLFVSGGGYGLLGGWSQDRDEQTKHLRGWAAVAIRCICEEIAGSPPQVGRIVRENDQTPRRKCLSRHRRTKAVAHVQASDDLEPVSSDHPLVRLLQNPNGPDTAFTFFYKVQMFLELTGNTYIWKVKNGFGQVVELWSLPAHWVRVRSAPGKLIGWYEVRPYGVSGWGGGQMLRFEPEEIIHIAIPNPRDPIDGFSQLTAFAEWLDVAESIDRCRVNQFANGAHGNFIVNVDKELFDSGSPDIEAFKARLKQVLSGTENAGQLVIAPGTTIERMDASPEEMAYVSSAEQAMRFAMMGFRTAPSIAGFTEDESYAGFVASQVAFNERTIRPKRLLLSQMLTEKLAKDFDEDLCIYYEFNAPSDPQQKLAEFNAAASHYAVTADDWRELLGIDPYPEGRGKDPIGPMGVAPIPLVSGEQIDVEALARVMQELHAAEQGGQGQEANPLAALGQANGQANGAPNGQPASRLPDAEGPNVGAAAPRLPVPGANGKSHAGKSRRR